MRKWEIWGLKGVQKLRSENLVEKNKNEYILISFSFDTVKMKTSWPGKHSIIFRRSLLMEGLVRVISCQDDKQLLEHEIDRSLDKRKITVSKSILLLAIRASNNLFQKKRRFFSLIPILSLPEYHLCTWSSDSLSLNGILPAQLFLDPKSFKWRGPCSLEPSYWRIISLFPQLANQQKQILFANHSALTFCDH